jgi:hypothetical protein
VQSLEVTEEAIVIVSSAEVAAMPLPSAPTSPVVSQETATEEVPATIAQPASPMEQIAQESAVHLEVAPPPVAASTPNDPSTTAAAVDEVLSFDFNGDGVFDFADFGPINVRAAVASAPQVSSGAAMPLVPAQAMKPAVVILDALHTCMAIPAMDDVEATEAWLDAFAVAWLADSDSRARRRDEAKLF